MMIHFSMYIVHQFVSSCLWKTFTTQWSYLSRIWTRILIDETIIEKFFFCFMEVKGIRTYIPIKTTEHHKFSSLKALDDGGICCCWNGCGWRKKLLLRLSYTSLFLCQCLLLSYEMTIGHGKMYGITCMKRRHLIILLYHLGLVLQHVPMT